MVAIITGDIVGSRRVNAEEWLPELKKIFEKYGSEPDVWEIYRGDSFQMETLPDDAFKAAVLIKAVIKQFKQLDVRIAIGIGEKTYYAEKVTQSNGSAFVYSGEAFENLKKRTLTVRSGWEDFDRTINLMLDLATLTMDYWGKTTSFIIKEALEQSHGFSQKELATLLNKKQSNISKSLKRGGFYEIRRLIDFYEQEIVKRCQP